MGADWGRVNTIPPYTWKTPDKKNYGLSWPRSWGPDPNEKLSESPAEFGKSSSKYVSSTLATVQKSRVVDQDVGRVLTKIW